VTVDEFRIGAAETYDVIVTPDSHAYTIFAQAMDRSGFARGTLAPRAAMSAEVPALDPRPLLTLVDMGHGAAAHAAPGHGTDHAAMGHAPAAPLHHPPTERGPGVDMQVSDARPRLDDPGVGLRDKLELDARGKADPARSLGSGFTAARLGLRVRYELRREFAPYVGVQWERALGSTADLRRADGDGAGDMQAVAGLRFWF
jgi:uncharacterized protein involved in copper resistance